MSAYGYGQVLMDSDDEEHEVNKTVAPEAHEDFVGGDRDGHLFAGSQSPANVSVTPASTGVFGAALHGLSRPRDYSDTIQALKGSALGVASYVQQKAKEATTTLKQSDWTKQQEALQRVITRAAETAESVGTVAAERWRQAREATSVGLRRFTGGPLGALCKQESATRPCPRVLLVCCTALVTNGLGVEGLFHEDVALDLTHYLLAAFEEGSGAVLPPPGTNPHILANVVKQFLLTLPEPLLTYRLLPEFLAAGLENPARAPHLLAELPLPNLASMQILLETLHRVAGNAAVNEMDARSLATCLAPCLGWYEPPKQSRKYVSLEPVNAPDISWRRGGDQSAPSPRPDYGDPEGDPTLPERFELNSEEVRQLAAALEYLIIHIRSPADSDPASFLDDVELAPPGDHMGGFGFPQEDAVVPPQEGAHDHVGEPNLSHDLVPGDPTGPQAAPAVPHTPESLI
eukprot:jgi/Botrbrau1/8570/Bobra.0359s0034.1